MTDSQSWRHFAASSYQKKNAASSSLSLHDALAADSPNTSKIAGATSSQASFFIAPKQSVLPPQQQHLQQQQQQQQGTTGLSPVSKQRQQRGAAVVVSKERLRDIALKHLYHPEMAAETAAALLASTNSAASPSPSRYSSLGLTPLKTAPLGVPLRRRLGLALMARGRRGNSGADDGDSGDEGEHDFDGDDDEDERLMERDIRRESKTAAEILRCIGARALLSKDIKPLHTTTATVVVPAKHAAAVVPNPARKLDVMASSAADDSNDGVPNNARPSDADADADQMLRAARTKHNISDAAVARIRHMLHSGDDVARPSPKPASRVNDESVGFASSSSVADTSQEYVIVGSQNKQPQQQQQQQAKQEPHASSSWLGVERDVNKPQQQQPQQTSQRTPVKKAATKNASNKPSTPSSLAPASAATPASRAADRTGDFRAPLQRALNGLSRMQQQQHSAAGGGTTAQFLAHKCQSLQGVALQIEAEENHMRLATASILAELVALKKLEQAAQAEALVWIEQQEQEHMDGDEQLAGAARAAEEFLMALQ